MNSLLECSISNLRDVCYLHIRYSLLLVVTIFVNESLFNSNYCRDQGEKTGMLPKMGFEILVSLMMKLKGWIDCHLLMIREDKMEHMQLILL